jgi:hypothetical protein
MAAKKCFLISNLLAHFTHQCLQQCNSIEHCLFSVLLVNGYLIIKYFLTTKIAHFSLEKYLMDHQFYRGFKKSSFTVNAQ